jgi:hypothetical protein
MSASTLTPREFIEQRDVRNALARVIAERQIPPDRHSYERTWNRHLQRMAGLIESGETDLFRVVDRFRASPLVDLRPEVRNVFGSVEEKVWFGARLCMNHVLYAPLRRALINAVLFDACRDDTESVVELGAGDGLNLFEFWLTASPRHAQYMNFEIARTGRLCTELLATLEPRMRVTAHPYDFCSPRYDPIATRQKHMLVFTIGSVGEVAELSHAVIEDLLDRADAVSGVHFEPVSWQLPGVDDPVHRQKCLDHGYNRNLWSLLSGLEAAGRIALDRVVANISGRTIQPHALIQWHKAQ